MCNSFCVMGGYVVQLWGFPAPQRAHVLLEHRLPGDFQVQGDAVPRPPTGTATAAARASVLGGLATWVGALPCGSLLLSKSAHIS